MRRKIRGSSRVNLIERLTDIFQAGAGMLAAGARVLIRSKIAVAGILAGLMAAFILILIMDFQKVKGLADFSPNTTTKIYDKNNILVSELFKQKREVVPFEKIPDNFVKALIAIEDNEFYEHFGVNPKGIVRAFFINIFSGRIRQGGSTITQQLSKILLTSRKRTIFRKIKEAFIAMMMEATFSKDEIINMYCNQIFLGHGAYGVESASQLYFEKHVWELNLAECALLASLPSAPNRLSPIRHPKRSMNRHRIVLAKMVEMGFINVSQAEEAYLKFWPGYLAHISEISPTITTWSSRVDRAPWFTEHVRRQLVDRFGEEMVYEKGLLVYTTVDVIKQEAAQGVLHKALEQQTRDSSNLGFKDEEYFIDNFTDTVSLLTDLFDLPKIARQGSREAYKVNSHIREDMVEEFEALNFIAGTEDISKMLDSFKKTYSSDRDLQTVEGCLVSINHHNGYIEAMVGGSAFSSINQLNRVMQSYRQPGSAIKPLLYSAAIESRLFTPATAILDAPVVYLDTEGGDWIPENYEGEYYGLVRLRQALARSINVISIRIAEKLGIEAMLKYYGKFLYLDDNELKKRVPRNFSIALGSFEVTPLELARAYATIAGGGKSLYPLSIRYVKSRDGDILYNPEEEMKKEIDKARKEGTYQVINQDTAQIMISMLSSVVNGGTGSAADPGRPACGKTGTTNNWRDAWFVGFTPELTTAIWIGYDSMGLSLGIGQSGGVVSAPVWGQYMREIFKDTPVSSFPVYAELEHREVCAKTGLIPSINCGRTLEEVFLPGTAPEQTCDQCEYGHEQGLVPTKGPRDNITGRQKKRAIREFKKGASEDILNDITRDLLRN